MSTQHEEPSEGFEAETLIPGNCPAHPALTTILVRRLVDGRIELGCHAPGGCVLTVPGAPLFDVLGEWLG